MPFTVNASYGVVGDDVHLVSGTAFRVRVLADGELPEMYGVERSPRAVGRPDIATYRRFVEAYVQEPQRSDYLSAVDAEEHRPTLLPAYDRVLAASDGRVWAQVHEVDLVAAHDWDVYDGDRRFVGQVRTPAGFYPMVITSGTVAGVWRDELGVEHVRAYRFTPL